MDTDFSRPQDVLYDESLVARFKGTADYRSDLNGGAKKRIKDLEPNAVILVPPTVDEWAPEGHLTRFLAELVGNELDLDRLYTQGVCKVAERSHCLNMLNM